MYGFGFVSASKTLDMVVFSSKRKYMALFPTEAWRGHPKKINSVVPQIQIYLFIFPSKRKYFMFSQAKFNV